jgi:hypothetical protein
MSLPNQPPLSEEPEQQPVLHSSEDTSTIHTSEDAPTQSVSPSDIHPENAHPEEAGHPILEDTPTLPEETSELNASEDIPTVPASIAESDGTVSSKLAGNENSQLNEDRDEDEGEDEDEDEPAGVFIRRGWLIAAACAVVAVALLATLLLVVNSPKDPPTDWIASYTPLAGTSSTGKILYYLHWTNQQGDLKGQLQLAANANGTPQSLTAPAVGLYNRENHIIYVVITINGQAGTLTGKINDANDTLTLNQVGATSQSSQLVFHMGSLDDYKQATKKLGANTK